MTDDERPDEVKPLNAFQVWVAQALEPMSPTLRIIVVGIACVLLVFAPFLLILIFS
jgi:hypothetical protein